MGRSTGPATSRPASGGFPATSFASDHHSSRDLRRCHPPFLEPTPHILRVKPKESAHPDRGRALPTKAPLVERSDRYLEQFGYLLHRQELSQVRSPIQPHGCLSPFLHLVPHAILPSSSRAICRRSRALAAAVDAIQASPWL